MKLAALLLLAAPLFASPDLQDDILFEKDVLASVEVEDDEAV